jgi:NADH-quinone oxidoreductase subunit A
MESTLLIVVFFTALVLVIAGTAMAWLLSPSKHNVQKELPYECGVPTRGTSWMQFEVGYYLFAILFLMFDVEAVFLFPWAVVVQELGLLALVNVLFFMLVLVLGLAYAWKKGALQWK